MHWNVESNRELQQRDITEKFVPIILVDESDSKIEIEVTGLFTCRFAVLPTPGTGSLCSKRSSCNETWRVCGAEAGTVEVFSFLFQDGFATLNRATV